MVVACPMILYRPILIEIYVCGSDYGYWVSRVMGILKIQSDVVVVVVVVV